MICQKGGRVSSGCYRRAVGPIEQRKNIKLSQHWDELDLFRNSMVTAQRILVLNGS
jgi:hypothetical protein